MADNWQAIISDIETIQEEGIDAVRVVETAYKVVKKNDEDVEVPDGLKGHIIPFDLVQSEKFQSELDSISNLQSKVEALGNELEEIRENFTEEELEAYCDSEKDNSFDKKSIVAGAKPKSDVEIETKEKLKKIVAVWDEQTKTNKLIKSAKQDLENKTIEAINNFTEAEIANYLHLKWIKPVYVAINSSAIEVINELCTIIVGINEKYEVTLANTNENIKILNEEISSMISELSGSDTDMYALTTLKDLL